MLIYIEPLPFARHHAKNFSYIISVIHFFKKVFVEHLLYVPHCPYLWGCLHEQDKVPDFPFGVRERRQTDNKQVNRHEQKIGMYDLILVSVKQELLLPYPSFK